MRQPAWLLYVFGALLLAAAATATRAAEPTRVAETAFELHPPSPVATWPWPPRCDDPDSVLIGPFLTNTPQIGDLKQAQPDPLDRPLPINLATALRLSDARPLVIAAAQASVLTATGQLERARVLWVPSLNIGAAYIRHDGGDQQVPNADLVNLSRNSMLAGGGLTVQFATTDAIFEPLAARQVLRSRQIDVQTARNNALLAVADAYFSVQQARGTYAGMLDAVTKGRELVRRIDAVAKGLVPPIEADRARTLLAELEQSAISAQEDWRVASANLARVLRLDPAAVIVPLEPDHLQVTLISPQQPVDGLVPIGLTNRPELASQQALVQATIARLRQERMRPLIPSLLLTGNSTPQDLFNGGIYGTGPGSTMTQFAARSDVSMQVVWQLENLGFGNQGRIRARQGEQQSAIVELFNTQDRVAAEVVQAHARLQSAALRAGRAETGLNEGLISYAGNLKGMSETIRFGDVLQLVNRPQEVVAALAQLKQAYQNYFSTVADYNRSQFRLFYALGYPAEILACERPSGEILPIDTNRLPPLPPVCAPEPCQCPR